MITVPSCDEHNSEKSHHDEYVLFALAASYTSSAVGLTQFITNVRRAFEHKPEKARNFIRQSTPVQLKRRGDARWEDGLQVMADGGRLDTVLENCARAIYFHETGQKFRGPAATWTNFTMYQDEAIQRNVTKAFDVAASFLSNAPRRGENESVFWYRFAENERTAIFYFCFYEHSPAIVCFKKIVIAR